MAMTTNRTRFLAAALVAITLAACGGSDDPATVNDASYRQAAPAGAITIGAGQASADVELVTVAHDVGPRLTRVSVAATVSGVTVIGNPNSAGVRWELREGSRVVASGPLAVANPGGPVGGTASYQMDVSSGAVISASIVGHVSGPPAGVQWAAAEISLQASLVKP